MGGSNTLLALGAIIIFGMFLRSSNQLMSATTQLSEQNEYYLTALSLAQSVISEAKTKAFDQKTVSGGVNVPDSLSAALGTDGIAETVPSPDTLSTSSPYTSTTAGYLSLVKFNDIDDYNGYTRTVNTPRAEGYKLSVKINWASPTYPDSTLISKSFCKKMTVTVKSQYMPDSITVTYAFVY
jgi:hypothetical protein